MKISELLTESAGRCPECGGPAFSDLILAEKKDACYHKVKASAKVWPSAYASGRLVQCRKKGAANYGNKNEDEQLDELTFLGSECTKDCSGHRAGYEWSSRRGNVPGNSPYSPSFNKGANLRAAGK